MVPLPHLQGMHLILCQSPYVLRASHASLHYCGGLGQKYDGLQTLAHAQAFKGIKSLVVSTIFNGLPAKGDNPLWAGIGYVSHAHACDVIWQLT